MEAIHREFERTWPISDGNERAPPLAGNGTGAGDGFVSSGVSAPKFCTFRDCLGFGVREKSDDLSSPGGEINPLAQERLGDGADRAKSKTVEATRIRSQRREEDAKKKELLNQKQSPIKLLRAHQYGVTPPNLMAPTSRISHAFQIALLPPIMQKGKNAQRNRQSSNVFANPFVRPKRPITSRQTPTMYYNPQPSIPSPCPQEQRDPPSYDDVHYPIQSPTGVDQGGYTHVVPGNISGPHAFNIHKYEAWMRCFMFWYGAYRGFPDALLSKIGSCGDSGPPKKMLFIYCDMANGCP